MSSTNDSLSNTQSDWAQINVGQSSPVVQMFHGRSVFITGASGFIGRVLLEKLLRSYQGIRRIYILMRPKKNQNPCDRLHKQLLKVPLFDTIRAMDNGQELLDKIVIVEGDIGEHKLGICDKDLATLEADGSLSIVFHSAATVRFDEPIRRSIELNLIATGEIINFCKRLPNLVGLCHVSTAYANSDILDNSDIEEKLYPINYSPHELIKMCQLLDDNLMQSLKVELVNRRPNTYTYTKAMAEHLIALEAADLPVTIVRPSMVTGAWREPCRGWVDNINGPTGLMLAIGKGLLRTFCAIDSVRADMIPVDVVVNTMIASTFYTAKLRNKLGTGSPVNVKLDFVQLSSNTDALANGNTKTNSTIKRNGCKNKENGTPSCLMNGVVARGGGGADHNGNNNPLIVHCNSSDLNPITWGQFELMFPIVRKYPSSQLIRYPFGTFKNNRYVDLIMRIFVHIIPAFFIDMICGLSGRKKQLLSFYNKMHGAFPALTHFSMQNYNFKTRNFKLVEASLSEFDRRDLFMDITSLDWRNYFDDYVLGARRFVLKEPDDNLPEARKSLRRAYRIEMGLRFALAAIACALLVQIFAKGPWEL